MFALATLSFVSCTDAPEQTGVAEQAAVNTPLPSNLSLVLNAKVNLTIGPFSQVFADVAASGPSGTMLFDVSSFQGFGFNALANTARVQVGANIAHLFGNDLIVDGFAQQTSLGLDPAALPQVPAATAASPGTTGLTVAANQTRQLCPGAYGAISVGSNARLNLNGGVYHVTRLTLAEGARLEPSEPVVIVVSGTMTTNTNAIVQPFSQLVNPMSAKDIRIEVNGAVNLGDGTQLRAHLLAPGTKVTTGKNVSVTGAIWAKNIAIGSSNFIGVDGVFSPQAAAVPPPCNDNNACTTDTCVGSGTAIAFCRNAAVTAGTSCEDGSVCNGTETCNATGQCISSGPLTAGTSCPDNTLCNGDETCDGFGNCVSGAPPQVNDGNACTSDTCDPSTGVSNDPVPDGTTCSGTGVCEAGVCSVESIIFSEAFFLGGSTTNQCNSWNDFLFNRLFSGNYSRVTMSGTFDPTGIECTDPSAATLVCNAMHNNTSTSVFCNGHVWTVGQCGGTEVTIDGSFCVCNFFGANHTVRPCTGTDVWGGVGTASCSAPSQTMTVTCE